MDYMLQHCKRPTFPILLKNNIESTDLREARSFALSMWFSHVLEKGLMRNEAKGTW
jgi:hypothetical protein